MLKCDQTSEVLVELYELTIMFTRKLQPKYYYQFRGDVHDLAMEFYCEFLTPKGRGEVKESLLDKYNPEITSLPYLVKVSVTRKLIDRSRADRVQLVSIDALITEYGDLMTKVFNLIDDVIDEELDGDRFLKEKVAKHFYQLDEFTRNSIFAKLYDSSSPLCDSLAPTFKLVHDCPVQQITDKTVVLFVPDIHKCINFSLQDGHPRGSIKPFFIETKGLELYHSGFDRDLFEDFLNDRERSYRVANK